MPRSGVMYVCVAWTSLVFGGPLAGAGVAGQLDEPTMSSSPSVPEGESLPGVTFNFKDAPFDLVIDFFSRTSGLPVIREADPPNASMSFISGETFPFDEALSILNLNLRMHGLHLRREDRFLYLSTLKDAARKAGPVAAGSVPEDLPPDRMVTVTIPLSNAIAARVAEQVSRLLGPFGAVTPVEAQNMVIVVESAEQARRIERVIRAVDEVRPADSEYRLFRLKHARASVAVGALKGLVGQREKTVIIDEKGQQRVVEDLEVAGVNLQADERTNSVIVVGPSSRIQVVEELIALIDQPEGEDGERALRTFEAPNADPGEAKRQIETLFRAAPAERRPVVLALEDAGKVSVVGSPAQLVQAEALLRAMDPTATDASPAEDGARVIRLTHLEAARAQQLIDRLLTPRQRRVLRTAPTPDGRGLVVMGPASEIEGVAALLSGLDAPNESDRTARVVPLPRGESLALLARARDLYEATAGEAQGEVDATIDADSRTVTLVGRAADVQAFERLLSAASGAVAERPTARLYEPKWRRPSALAGQLARLAPAMLSEGAGDPAPVFEGLDDLGSLVIRATAAQSEVVDRLIERLDKEDVTADRLRVVRLRGPDPAGLVERARTLYERRVEGDPALRGAEAEYDAASGSLLLTGSASATQAFAEGLEQLQRLAPPERVTRLLDVRNADAGEIVVPLRAFLAGADPIDPGRAAPAPEVRVIERTNSLLVTAEDAQHRLIVDFVARLDRIEPTDLPPLKLLQLRTADAVAIASMLNEQYSKRSQAERAARPVDVRADPATNTLIVSAHEGLFDEIRTFVDELNKDLLEGPERVTVLFPLKVAKAVDVAAAMDRLYPEPPAPLDRRGRPMPWMREPKEVSVSADASSNALIIDAPADRLESLQELASKLDRVELPPVADLRTYRIVNADLGAVSRTLGSLARQGNLSGPAQPGKPPVQVVIESEPLSGTLIVAGDETTFERVEAMLEDLSAAPVERGLRVAPIANADASEIRDRAMEIYAAQIEGDPRAGDVEVSVDASSNSLMVVGDDEALDRFMSILDQLQRQIGPARELRLIELRFAPPERVVAFLNDLRDSSRTFVAQGGAEPVFEPIEETGSVLVAAQPDQLSMIEQLVRSLDSEQAEESPPLRILRLRTTDAANLAQVLQTTYERRPADERSTKPVDIRADAATNTLIVSAHPEVLPEIEGIVRELNETQTLAEDDREIRIFPLRIARAEDLARTIDQMFPEPPMPIDPRTRRPRPDLQQPREVVVRADRATNSLIVDAPAKRLAGFERIVESLDQEALAGEIELRTYALERADLAAAAGALRELAASNALGGATRAPVTVATEPVSRTLVVSGPPEVFSRVEAVLSELESPPDRPSTGLKMFPLKHARAERLQPLLERLLVTRLREAEGVDIADDAEARLLLEVVADRATNTLIVSAPEAALAVAGELIGVLDAEGAGSARTVVRVTPLTFAPAAETAEALRLASAQMDLPAGGPVTVSAAPGSNALVLTGAPADLDAVEALIEPLDQRPSDAESMTVETFGLEHAEAAAIAGTVERLLVQQRETDPRILSLRLRYTRGAGLPPTGPAIRVEADERTNALVVSGPAASVELARSIIERLDQPSASPDARALTYTPARAAAADLVRAVSPVLARIGAGGRDRVELIPDAATGSVIVLGPNGPASEAVGLLMEFDDRTPATPRVEVAVVDLARADASAVAPVVARLLSDRSRWPEDLLRAERAGVPVASPVVNTDPSGARLIISAPSPLMPEARAVVAALDMGEDASTVRVFRMKEGDAASVASAVDAALRASAPRGQTRVSVTAEPASNAVVVAGPPDRLAEAAGLIESMDASAGPSDLGARTVLLERARAEAVAPVLESVLTRESVMEQLPPFARAAFLGRFGDQTGVPVRVAADRRLNAIVVSGPPEILDLAETLARELDRAPETGVARDDRRVRVIPMRHGDALAAAASLEAVFAEETGGQAPPTITVDRAANALIVRGASTQLEMVAGVLDELDRAALSASREVRTISVDRSRADAAAMAETLRRLLEERGGVRVEVISAEALLDAEDRSEPAGERPGRSGSHACPPPLWLEESARPLERVVQLRASISLASIASAVRFERSETHVSTRPPAEPASDDQRQDDPTVTIAVDPATNTLVVVGSPRIADRVAALVRELEAQMPPEPVAVRVVTLPEGSDARAVANLVQQTVRQVGPASAENPGGFTGRVAAAPDPNGDAVIVWANDTDFEALRALIGATARVRAGDRLTVKVYPLESVSAVAAANAVRDLVSASPSGRQARRLRALDLRLDAGEGGAEATIDPNLIRVSADPGGTALIVVAPDDAMELIDRFVGLIDQSPLRDRLAIKRYTLDNAAAGPLSGTLQRLFDAQRQGPGARELPRARFVADDRTNTLLVTASGDQHEEVERLIAAADTELQDQTLPLEIIPLRQARPSAVQRVVERIVVGRDPAKRERVQISADDASNLFLVRAPQEELDEIRRVVSEVDAADTSGLPVRIVTLERADPEEVATAIRAFMDERASSTGAGRARAPVALTAHRASRTLVVAAADEAFAEIQRLIEAMDSEEQRSDVVVRVVALQHADYTDLEDAVREIGFAIQTGFQANWWQNERETGREERIRVTAEARSNSFVLVGAQEAVDRVEELIRQLDQPSEDGAVLTARSVVVEEGDLESIAQAIRTVIATPDWRWWRGRDPKAVDVRVDALRRRLLLVGRPESIALAEGIIADLVAGQSGPERVVETIALEHARADRAARSLERFFAARARAEGGAPGAVSVVGSPDGNLLIVSADEASLPLVRSLAEELDRPELGDDRAIEVFALRNADAGAITPTIRAVFPQGRSEERVIVTAQGSGDAVIVSAPTARMDEVRALIDRLDAAPTREAARLVTVPLTTARASEVAQALRSSLPASVKVGITPVSRSNSLLLSGSDEAIALVRDQITELDRAPDRPLTMVKRLPLQHAVAEDAFLTLSRLMRGSPRADGQPAPVIDYLPDENALVVSATAAGIAEVERMLEQVDVRNETTRRTEFVRLEFAQAEAAADALGVFFGRFAPEATTLAARRAAIVPDPASNSLVVSADEEVWPRIEALLSKLDAPEYDTTRQLAVIPLAHADAPSVARALNDGFRPTIEDRARAAEREARGRSGRRDDDRRDEFLELPTVLVAAEDTPIVSAEPETNALIVFAGRRELERIRAIVEQLDVPEFARTAPPRLIPLASGRASAIATTLNAVFERRSGREGSRAVIIEGDDASSTLVVRADDEIFVEIVELARSLEIEAARSSPSPRVIRLTSSPATRMRSIVQAAVRPMAQRLGEPLSVEVDRQGNALVVTASAQLLAEVERLVAELEGTTEPETGEPDAPRADAAPVAADDPSSAEAVPLAAGQSMRIVELEHHDPEAMRGLVERLGVTQAASPDGMGVVVDPVRVVPMRTRRAVSLLGASDDVAAVARIIGALDREPTDAGQTVGMVHLRVASAEAVAATLTRMLTPGTSAQGIGAADALAEQVRRLSMLTDHVDTAGMEVDLTRPLRLIPDPASNRLIIASTPANVVAVRDLARLLDTLPMGDAVVVRIFPLQHAAAARIRPILEQLFREGEALRRLPGTQRRGLPPTATGQALAGEIAVSVDERTNALIVAGREEAVALVEVLIADLDSDRAARWVEPAIVELRHADATRLAETLRRVLLEGMEPTPETEALRRQVGRLRVSLSGGDGARFAEADVFVPLSSLVITADESMNALVVVGTPANIAIVRELVAMLDVEAAAAGNLVRVYPLEHAAAERVAGLASEVFRQREDAGALRREDRLTVAPDVRTNALIVSTSPRGFAIFETLLRTLDAPDANFSVGLHVLPVTGADAAQLAPRIERLMRERIDSARRAGSVELPSDAFSIEADAANNLLIVAASDENLAVVKDLLDAMTRDSALAAGADRTELISVRSGRADEIAEAVRTLYADRENERRGQRSVSVVSNERLNAVIVSGSQDDIAAIRSLVNELESAQVTAVQDVKRIELKAANAIEVVNLIQTVLSGRPIDGRRGAGEAQATRLRFFRRQMESELEDQGLFNEAEIDAAIRGQVRLTPDLRTNSVVVAAPPAVMGLVEAIIQDLDTTTAGSRKIEIFELENADARAMAVVLRDLFNLQQQGDRFVLIPTQTTLEDEGDQLRLGNTTLTPVPDERQELSITIDARTNTILISGTAEYLSLVREVVDRLDEIEATERESFVYHLQNAKADEAEVTLQSYFESEARRVRELLGPDQQGSAVRQLEQEVTVVGDAASNKLVVSASPRYAATVERIIAELDAAPPQVMIQVLLAEVTLDEEDTWGSDFEIGPLGGQAYQVATSAASGGLATAIGTPNLSVATADFSLLVRALEVQGKLEVLSRPQVTVNNNEPAFIQVGEDVAIVTGVERLESGNTRSDVERRDVGIILNVTPSISNDGFVRMEISPEISAVTTRTTQVSEDFEAPIISQRRIETTVTVQDGETVVIGGLIQTLDEERISKVPLLGDIPVLGVPFRATQRSRVKTELLVILTPTVIPGDSVSGLRSFRLKTEQAIDEMSKPGRIREAVRGRPSPALGRPVGAGPAVEKDETGWLDGWDDSVYPREALPERTPAGLGDRP